MGLGSLRCQYITKSSCASASMHLSRTPRDQPAAILPQCAFSVGYGAARRPGTRLQHSANLVPPTSPCTLAG